MQRVKKFFYGVLILFFVFYLLFFYFKTNIYASKLYQDINLSKTKIAFHSNMDGDSDIYLIKPDGTGLINVTDDEYNNYLPSWSPNGQKIAYVVLPEGSIYLTDPEGKNKEKINAFGYALCPDWSPNGNKIVYMSKINKDPGFNIFLINANGTNPLQLTDNNFIDAYPKWSPDGNKIAFISNRNGSYELFVMNIDGSNIKYLASLTDIKELGIIKALSISWSPDGKKIAFSSDKQGNFDIYIINADSTNLTNITNTENNEALPSWSPDGLYITFISIDENGKEQLYIMNKDGSGKRKITNFQFNSGNPDWSPVLETYRW